MLPAFAGMTGLIGQSNDAAFQQKSSELWLRSTNQSRNREFLFIVIVAYQTTGFCVSNTCTEIFGGHQDE